MASAAEKPLNKQAVVVEEAESALRIAAKHGYLNRHPRALMEKEARRVIEGALKRLPNDDLRRAAEVSLWRFFREQLRIWSTIRGERLAVLLAILSLNGSSAIENPIPKQEALRAVKEYAGPAFVDYTGDIRQMGVPLGRFGEEHTRKLVRPVLDRLRRQKALDPGDVDKRNSLRNRAEMEVRYQDNLSQIERLREKGERLVIASTHADCSERCRGWQGRVYSLDGTSGTTPDGRKYVPLEEATDVWYVTKAGKRYKNGLLGFNCRHRLVPYKNGLAAPSVPAEVEVEEYAVTQKQRQLERNVRRWRAEAEMTKGLDPKAYRKAREKALGWNRRYISFSKAHGRAYYPSRTRII